MSNQTQIIPVDGYCVGGVLRTRKSSKNQTHHQQTNATGGALGSSMRLEPVTYLTNGQESTPGSEKAFIMDASYGVKKLAHDQAASTREVGRSTCLTPRAERELGALPRVAWRESLTSYKIWIVDLRVKQVSNPNMDLLRRVFACVCVYVHVDVRFFVRKHTFAVGYNEALKS